MGAGSNKPESGLSVLLLAERSCCAATVDVDFVVEFARRGNCSNAALQYRKRFAPKRMR